jgi:hydroxylaminobenzene mutase
MATASNTLCFTGVLLFFIGLVNGLIIPKLRSPRLGLSAHLTGVQCGTVLIAIGLLWPHLSFWSGWENPLAQTIWISFYTIWLGMFLAGLWGTGKTLSIAGAGYEGKPWQESAARTVLAVGSIANLLAILAVLVQWHWAA